MRHVIKLRSAEGKRYTTYINAPTRERAEEIVRRCWSHYTILPPTKRKSRPA